MPSDHERRSKHQGGLVGRVGSGFPVATCIHMQVTREDAGTSLWWARHKGSGLMRPFFCRQHSKPAEDRVTPGLSGDHHTAGICKGVTPLVPRLSIGCQCHLPWNHGVCFRQSLQ